MDVLELKLSDAEAVENLAGLHYPPDYNIPLDDICENLTKQDKESIFLGLKLKGRLLGYLIGWIDNTMVEGLKQDVMLVDDVVLQSDVRHQFYRLLKVMVDTMEARGFGKLPLEASTRPDTSEHITGHPNAFSRLGYELTQTATFFDEELQEELTWIRYETIIEEDAVIDEKDILEIDFE